MIRRSLLFIASLTLVALGPACFNRQRQHVPDALLGESAGGPGHQLV